MGGLRLPGIEPRALHVESIWGLHEAKLDSEEVKVRLFCREDSRGDREF